MEPGAGHRLPSPAAGLSLARFTEDRARAACRSGSRGSARLLAVGSSIGRCRTGEAGGNLLCAD